MIYKNMPYKKMIVNHKKGWDVKNEKVIPLESAIPTGIGKENPSIIQLVDDE